MTRIVSVYLPHWAIERIAIRLWQSEGAGHLSTAAAMRQQDERIAIRPWQSEGAGHLSTAAAMRQQEERLNQHIPGGLPGEPMALIESGARGIWLSALNGAAEQRGLTPGLALADARALLPTLTVRDAEPAADRTGIRKLARWLGRYGPNRNAYGLPQEAPSGRQLRSYGLWADITGVAHLYGGEPALLADLKRRLASFGLTANVGLADTFGAAHALAWHGGRSEIAAPGATLAAISSLPVAALRLDRARVQLLHRLGLKQIGQLAALPRAGLERRFRSRHACERVLARLDQALGVICEPRRPLETPPALSVTAPFPEPLISAEILEHEAHALVVAFCARLDVQGLGVRAARLVLTRSDGTQAAIPLALSHATRAPAHLIALLREKLSALDCGFGIDWLALEAIRTEPLSARQQALTRAGSEPQAEVSAQLIDRLVSRLGGARVTYSAPQASHWPERAQAVRSALDHPRPPPDTSHTKLDVRRPLLLLAPPEPIAIQPMTVLPVDGRWRCRSNAPAKMPITAIAEIPEGSPVRFTWRRVLHTVVRTQGPERIEPEWWRELSSNPLRTRDYYTLEDAAGARFWVFQAGRSDDGGEEPCTAVAPPSWFIHGVFA